MGIFSTVQIEKINAMLHELSNEKDRSSAILLGAEIDKVLYDVLNAYLLPEKGKTSSPLLGIDGPLGTLASRIEVVYRVGLISPIMHRELQLLRKIRNHFAHTGVGISFDKSPISELVNSLHIPQWVAEGNANATVLLNAMKTKFILSGAASISLLTYVANNIERVKECRSELVDK